MSQFGRQAEAKPNAKLEADPEGYARDIVTRQLSDRARSRSDLEQALATKGVPGDVAAGVLDRFEEVGLVDDADFARSWVQSRQRTKGLAPRVLAQELRRKGIDDDVAQDALGELDPDDEIAAAHRLVQKKLRSMSSLDLQTKLRRLTSMLARKGYSGQVVFDVVRKELDAEPPPLESM